MYLLQLAQFFGHLVGALLLLALFSHGAVTSLSACATTGTVRSPERLGHRAGAEPSTLLPLVQSPPTPHLHERRLVGRGYTRIGKSVQPVRGKGGAGITLKVSGLQQFIDQGTTLAPARVQAYADRRCPHLHVWGGVPKDLPSHVPQHPHGLFAHVYLPI